MTQRRWNGSRSLLIPYVGPPLTVGGELNKLATNLGQGRNWAGIHFRSDAASSLPQAEEVAMMLASPSWMPSWSARINARSTRAAQQKR